MVSAPIHLPHRPLMRDVIMVCMGRSSIGVRITSIAYIYIYPPLLLLKFFRSHQTYIVYWSAHPPAYAQWLCLDDTIGWIYILLNVFNTCDMIGWWEELLLFLYIYYITAVRNHYYNTGISLFFPITLRFVIITICVNSVFRIPRVSEKVSCSLPLKTAPGDGFPTQGRWVREIFIWITSKLNHQPFVSAPVFYAREDYHIIFFLYDVILLRWCDNTPG